MAVRSFTGEMERKGRFLEVAAESWGELNAARARWAPGLNGEALRAMYDDGLCPVLHWGYVISGSISVRYADGRVETARAGDLYYLEPGHSPSTEEGAEIVEFSPVAAAQALRDRAAAVLGPQ